MRATLLSLQLRETRRRLDERAERRDRQRDPMLLGRIATPGGDLLLRGAVREAREQIGRVDVDERRRGRVAAERLLQLLALIAGQVREQRLERRERELALRREHAGLRAGEQRQEALHDLVEAIGLPLLAIARDLLRERRAGAYVASSARTSNPMREPHELFDASSASTHAAGR